jgi:hypothetical protein
VLKGTKKLTPTKQLQHQVNGIPTTTSNLCLVPVNTIYKPIAAIPHQGGNLGEFMFIRPCENLGYGCLQMIKEQEPFEDNGNSDSDSDSDSDSGGKIDDLESLEEEEVDNDSNTESDRDGSTESKIEDSDETESDV